MDYDVIQTVLIDIRGCRKLYNVCTEHCQKHDVNIDTTILKNTTAHGHFDNCVS